MSRQQKWLLTGSLALIVGGVLFGFLYGWQVQHGTLLVLKESYGAALHAAASGDPATMLAEIARGQELNYRLVRAVDVHTHVIKLGMVLLLAGLLWPIFGRNLPPYTAPALLGGAVIFPTGVFLEIYTPSPFAQGVAALGAGLVILGFAGLCRKLFLPGNVRSE